MVHRTYIGLGTPDAAVREFDALAPHVVEMLTMQGECAANGPDHAAMGVALDGVQTAAYHFTRRPHFYHALLEQHRMSRRGANGRLSDRAEAITAFRALAPYHSALQGLQGRCRPFGRDYLALEVAKQGLDTAAFHFTGEAAFYGARGDSAGPTRPRL